MKFHGPFRHSQLGGYLLVQKSKDDLRHHFAFPRRERIAKGAQTVQLDPLRDQGTIALDRLPNRVEQILFAKRLGKEFDRSRLHRLNRHGDVAVSRNEVDRYLYSRRAQLLLQIKAGSRTSSTIQDGPSVRPEPRNSAPVAKVLTLNPAD